MVNFKINGINLTAKQGTTILTAAHANGVHIPTLCFLKDTFADSLCRVCVVEVAGSNKLMPACSTPVREGMEIYTDSEIVAESRKMTLDFICRNHRMDCDYCSRASNCELHALLREHGMDDRIYSCVYHEKEKDCTSPAIVRDYSKCVKCRRCEQICAKQEIFAIGALNRASSTRIGSAVPMPESGCIGCGQCLTACPTGALSVKNENKALRIALNRKQHVLVALSETEPEIAGKLTHILRSMGAEKVFSAGAFKSMAAKEVAQLVAEGKTGISPLCPAAAKVSSKEAIGRHPEAIFDAWCKDTYAAENGLDTKSIFTVWISPCTALKASHQCDLAMTESELGEAIRRACVSRYTMHQVWKDAEIAELDASVSVERDVGDELGSLIQNARTVRAEGVPAIRTAADYDFADFFACPGGCRSGGGHYRK